MGVLTMKKAVIEQGKVINIIELAGDTPVGIQLPLGQELYACGTYPVAIGDNFQDGMFFREGKRIVSLPTLEDQILELRAQLEDLQSR